MIGAIAGDIIGSVYEAHNIKTTDFPLFDPRCRFTDDTVLTLAVADAIITGEDYGLKLKEWYRFYPNRGYGPGFRKWAASGKTTPRSSFGNGSAMRVSPVGFAFNTLDEVLEEAKKSAEPSHNHPEGIKGAQAVASAVFLARKRYDKQYIKNHIAGTFSYNLDRTVEEIRPTYRFDVSCQGSVPEAIIAFLESTDLESAIRLAVSLGGDSDTIACIAGGIAQAYYVGVPERISSPVLRILDDRQRSVINAFAEKYVHTMMRRENMGMLKIGPKGRTGDGSLMKEASADDPIYTRGYAIGFTLSGNSSKNTPEQPLPESNPPYDLSQDEVLSEIFEQSLSELYKRLTEQKRKDQPQSSESTTPEDLEQSSPEKPTEQD